MNDNQIETRIAERIDLQVTATTGISASGGVDFANMTQLMEFAKVMSIAQVAIPKHLRSNPGACLAVAIQASEWQMSPFAVANKTYVVNDRLAYEAQLINAVILRRAPIEGRMKIDYSGEGGKRRCKVSANLKGGGTVEYESPEIDRIKVKNSPLWIGDPDQQLFYFASRSMCRRHFPDVILGIYTADELAEATPITAREIPQVDAPKFTEKKVESAIFGTTEQPLPELSDKDLM
jgi:hypothetical protein